MKKRNKRYRIASQIIAGCLMMVMLVSCAGRKKTIRTDGLFYARLGDEMPEAGIGTLRGKRVTDTIFMDDDYEWRAAQLGFRKGNVYIEEDFFRTEKVNRIRVETPELKLRNGLCVGMTIADLASASNEWFIVPMPRFNRWDFYSRLYPRIHFVIDEPGKPISETDEQEWEKFVISDFSPTSKIEMIVIY